MSSSIMVLAPLERAASTRGASAYAAARRHSSWVRTLKFVIPFGATVAVALVLVVAIFDPFGRLPGLTLGPVSLSGNKIAMESPRLTGFRKDARPYEVTAKAAYQDIHKPNVIELKSMNAHVTIDESGAVANLISPAGVFDTTKEQLEFANDIKVTTTRGEEAWLKSASVDFKRGTIMSDQPVVITTPRGTIEARGLRVSDNGKAISFTGHVHMQLNHGEAAGGTGAAGPLPQAQTVRAEPTP